MSGLSTAASASLPMALWQMNQSTAEQCFRFRPELVPGFSIPLCVCNQRCHQLQNIFFRMDIRHRVVMHRLFKVDGVENFNVVVILQKSIAAFADDTSLGVCDHIRTVHLKQVGLQPKSGFTGTGAADDQNIFISGIGRIFRAVAHHQSLRFCENDIILKLRSHEWFNIFGSSPGSI